MYVKQEDVKLIPELFIINFDELDYFIFAGTDVLKCFICKQERHIAKNCTQTTPNVHLQLDSPQITEPSTMPINNITLSQENSKADNPNINNESMNIDNETKIKVGNQNDELTRKNADNNDGFKTVINKQASKKIK